MKPDFRIVVTPSKSPISVSHSDRLVSIGSCFSENVGRYFEQGKFDVDINPFGQQYNPASIANAMNRLLSAKPYTDSGLVMQDEVYHSFDHHGDFSKTTKEETLSGINNRITTSSEKLKKASVLFLTFGTAHVFRQKSSGAIVSNCHKIPGKEFDFALLSPDEIVTVMSESFDALWKVNSNVQIILTVSPVRYFAFGHYENSVSKGHLFAAINLLKEKYPQLYYFPAYEIVMDELRDYRFFADDMLHPSHLAIAYVWEQLSKTLFSTETQNLLKQIEEINAAINHRPRNPDSDAHKKFKESYQAKMKAMEEEYGFDFS